LRIKFNKYLRAGVREYWIVDPDTRLIKAHILNQDKYISVIHEADVIETIPVSVLPGCEIDVKAVFTG
jgi:Uma2 family endonuclease